MTTELEIAPYVEQVATWPRAGRHILAQFDEASVIVYQAYRPAIAEYAVEHQRFGGEFSFSRMSWVKPNFLWMMYRSGWATKEGQERVLAVRLGREFFERIVTEAVPSTWSRERYATREDWQAALKRSQVRLQWDPDHDPSGNPVDRRAIQLGLRGSALREYATDAVVEILDVTPLVERERAHAFSPYRDLVVPRERELVLRA